MGNMKVLTLIFILSVFSTRRSSAGFAEERVAAAAVMSGDEPAVMSEDKTAVCKGTSCPMGCCPEPDWKCCPDQKYCASAEEFCPEPFNRKEILIIMNHLYQDCSEGTLCEGGCCERPNWHCCEDGRTCASHPDKC